MFQLELQLQQNDEPKTLQDVYDAIFNAETHDHVSELETYEEVEDFARDYMYVAYLIKVPHLVVRICVDEAIRTNMICVKNDYDINVFSTPLSYK